MSSIDIIDGNIPPDTPARTETVGSMKVIDKNTWVCLKLQGKKQWFLFSSDEAIKKYTPGTKKINKVFVSPRAVLVYRNNSANEFVKAIGTNVVHVGSDKKNRGNALLIQIDASQYMYIADKCYSFKINGDFVRFKSKVVDDNVLSIIETKTHFILFPEMKIVSKDKNKNPRDSSMVDPEDINKLKELTL